MRLGTCSSSSSLGTLSGLRLETGLDSADGTLGTALFAGDKKDTVLLGELCLGTLAGFADDVFGDISPKNVLDLLGLETTTDD